jgi:drug/metabolite transporter (DMT)-like permease
VITGQLLALSTALFWSLSSLSFEAASRRAGSVAVNLVRLVMAFILLCIVGLIVRGRPLPTDANAHQWKWLLLSGFVGFFIGDLCLFRALVILGARITTLLASLAPIIAAITGYFWLDERLSGWSLLGMALTLAGIAWVVSERAAGAQQEEVIDSSGEIIGLPAPDAAAPEKPGTEAARITGVILGILAAAGQGVGLVITKIAIGGENHYDAFAATQIRAIAGIAVFALLVLIVQRFGNVIRALQNPAAMGFMSIGAFTGPFLGVSLLNMSIQRISAGVAQTLSSLVPVIIIPFVVVVKKERVTPRAVLGALIAVAGVAVLMLGGSQH